MAIHDIYLLDSCIACIADQSGQCIYVVCDLLVGMPHGALISCFPSWSGSCWHVGKRKIPLSIINGTCNSCNMGVRDLPDMYAQSPRARGIHISQIMRAHVTSNMYHF